MLRGYFGGIILRAVIHDNDFETRVLQLARGIQRATDGAGAVARANDDRDEGPRVIHAKWHVFVYMSDDFQGEFRLAVARGEPKFPILDLVAAAKPLVGPREHKHSGASTGEDGPRLPFEHSCLSCLSVADAVETDLGHEQRPLTGKVLQPRNVSLQLLPCLEI